MIQIRAPHSGEMLELYGGTFTDLCLTIHEFNTQWWLDPHTGERKDRNVGEMLMLMTSELSEALEAHRKNLQDDKLPQYHGVDVELVDCVIRAMDYLGARFRERQARYYAGEQPDPSLLYTPGEVLEQKSLYNSQRADHRPENRIQPGGKAY